MRKLSIITECQLAKGESWPTQKPSVNPAQAYASASPIAHLQRTLGNRAIGRLLRSQPPINCLENEYEPHIVPSDPQTRFGILRSPGQPLPQSERQFFEPQFAHDFSRVRLHTDRAAADCARQVNARAFTIGQDIVFGDRQFAPRTTEGQKLLAHELTHVVQQAGTRGLVQRKKMVNLGVEVPQTAVDFKPKYRYPWQNPHLRATIYPHREKELRDFLRTYKEIELYQEIEQLQNNEAGRARLATIAEEIGKERSWMTADLSTARTAQSKARRALRAHRRTRSTFFGTKHLKELRAKRAKLAREMRTLRSFRRYPKWLRYMVIHFSGMRYKIAHGSWASPQKLLKILKRQEVSEKIQAASEETVAESAEKVIDDLKNERNQTKSRKRIRAINAQISQLNAPQIAVERILGKKPHLKERFERLQRLEREIDELAVEIAQPRIAKTDTDLHLRNIKRRQQLQAETQAIERQIGSRRLRNIRYRMKWAEQVRRQAVLKYEIKQAIARIPPNDFEALGVLKAMKDVFPSWVWQEIVRHTRLRQDVTSPGWEHLTPAEKRARAKRDPVTKRWRSIMYAWRKNITQWRKKHSQDLSLVVTRLVCNEVAEHAQHVRGVKPAGGLTAKTQWYRGQALAMAPGIGQEPIQWSILPSYFKRPTSVEDFTPKGQSGASIFWLAWRSKPPGNWSIARPLRGVAFKTEKGETIKDGKFDQFEGWTYHIKNNEISRTATGSSPGRRTHADEPNVLKEWLGWTHEATVVEVAQLGRRKVVLTFETGQIGLRTREYQSLVNKWNIFVGYVPPGKASAALDEKLKQILSGRSAGRSALGTQTP